MWVVLTEPTKKGYRWESDDFFASGVTAVEEILQRIKKLDVDLNPGTAIDFGCGLGRLTQALSFRFEKSIGVDLSESMIQQAQEYNRFPDKCTYLVNAEPDLRQIPSSSADFVLSLIALQHTSSVYQQQYIDDFFRILKPGGIAYFQVIQATFLRGLIPDSFTERYRHWKNRGKPFISMYGLAESKIRRIIAAHGAVVLDCHVEPNTDITSRWMSYRWCVRK